MKLSTLFPSSLRSLSSVLLITAALGSAAACGDDPADEPTFDPASTQYGKTMAQWGEAWWTWLVETPATNHPVLGGPCGTAQSGDVFFLTGNFGGTESRNCTVPAVKALFFPITTNLCYPSPEDPAEGCSTPSTTAALTACAGSDYDDPAVPKSLEVTLDGEVIADPLSYRAHTGQFSWTAPTDMAEWLFDAVGPIPTNTCGIPTGDRFGVADGYWIMLKPLAAGSHTLRFASTVGAGADAFTIDMTYTITQQ